MACQCLSQICMFIDLALSSLFFHERFVLPLLLRKHCVHRNPFRSIVLFRSSISSPAVIDFTVSQVELFFWQQTLKRCPIKIICVRSLVVVYFLIFASSRSQKLNLDPHFDSRHRPVTWFYESNLEGNCLVVLQIEFKIDLSIDLYTV